MDIINITLYHINPTFFDKIIMKMIHSSLILMKCITNATSNYEFCFSFKQISIFDTGSIDIGSTGLDFPNALPSKKWKKKFL